MRRNVFWQNCWRHGQWHEVLWVGEPTACLISDVDSLSVVCSHNTWLRSGQSVTKVNSGWSCFKALCLTCSLIYDKTSTWCNHFWLLDNVNKRRHPSGDYYWVSQAANYRTVFQSWTQSCRALYQRDINGKQLRHENTVNTTRDNFSQS